MKDLTQDQQQALERERSLLLRDPRTDRVYALVPADVDNRLSPNTSEASGMSAATRQSKESFLRDLPALLQNPRYDGWTVAYCGSERIKLDPSEVEVIRECLKRGLKRSEYYLGAVLPYDHDGEIERSLYEFEHIEE